MKESHKVEINSTFSSLVFSQWLRDTNLHILIHNFKKIIIGVEKPDLQQSTLNGSSNLRSTEDTRNVDKPVTSKYNDRTSKEFISKGRGDSESIAIEIIGESLESRSSVLGKLRDQSSETNIDDDSNTEPEVMEPISEAPINISEQQPQVDTDITTQKNFHEDNEIPLITQHNLEQNELKFTTSSDELIKKLLPTTDSDFSNQISDQTEDITKATIVLNKNVTNDVLPEILSDFEIENIVTSKLQPATLRRKDHIPKEFQCQRWVIDFAILILQLK